MTKSIQLPTTTDELKAMLKVAIEFSQDSPVGSESKLNECLARSLNFDNYDQLSPLLEPQAVIVKAYIATIPEYLITGVEVTVLNNVEISSAVFSECMVNHILVCRFSEMSKLRSFANSAEERDVLVSDLDYLMSLNDSFVFRDISINNLSSNNYISPTANTVKFNAICEDVLSANSRYLSSLVADQEVKPKLSLVPENEKNAPVNRLKDSSGDVIVKTTMSYYKTSEHYKYNAILSEDGNTVIINDVEINPLVFKDELVEYLLVNRLGEIPRLVNDFSEDDRAIRGLQHLRNVNDTLVFASIYENDFISKTLNSNEFNSICEGILVANKNLK